MTALKSETGIRTRTLTPEHPNRTTEQTERTNSRTDRTWPGAGVSAGGWAGEIDEYRLRP